MPPAEAPSLCGFVDRLQARCKRSADASSVGEGLQIGELEGPGAGVESDRREGALVHAVPHPARRSPQHGRSLLEVVQPPDGLGRCRLQKRRQPFGHAAGDRLEQLSSEISLTRVFVVRT